MKKMFVFLNVNIIVRFKIAFSALLILALNSHHLQSIAPSGGKEHYEITNHAINQHSHKPLKVQELSTIVITNLGTINDVKSYVNEDSDSTETDVFKSSDEFDKIRHREEGVRSSFDPFQKNTHKLWKNSFADIANIRERYIENKSKIKGLNIARSAYNTPTTSESARYNCTGITFTPLLSYGFSYLFLTQKLGIQLGVGGLPGVNLTRITNDPVIDQAVVNYDGGILFSDLESNVYSLDPSNIENRKTRSLMYQVYFGLNYKITHPIWITLDMAAVSYLDYDVIAYDDIQLDLEGNTNVLRLPIRRENTDPTSESFWTDSYSALSNIFFHPRVGVIYKWKGFGVHYSYMFNILYGGSDSSAYSMHNKQTESLPINNYTRHSITVFFDI